MSARTVLITGVCGGIGRAAATAFTSAGWSVIGVDRAEPDSPLDLDRFERVDVSDGGQIAGLFDQLGSEISELHALVNNAATQVNLSLIHI